LSTIVNNHFSIIMPAEEKKQKKTKLEKICELESSVKLLKEENRRCKKEVAHLKEQHDDEESQVSEFSDFPSVTSPGGVKTEEKLKDALRALKRVTVKQELSLKTLRSKAKQRRNELEQKDSVIEQMREEIRSLKKAHDRMRGKDTDDVGMLKTRVVDLELKLAKEDTKNEEQNKRLVETTENVSTLRGQLDGLKGREPRRRSSKSLRSTESSLASKSSVEDVNKLKRELAKKMEKIANLEYDLETAQEEIVEMKQSKFAMDGFGDGFETAFPATPAPGAEDFFSDDEDGDDDFWGT
jgi:DNA repair exonuclease SbcCD ATPase subunit